MKKSKIIALFIIMTMAISLGACTSKDKDEKTVYATIAPVYDFTKRIAGDKQNINLIISSNVHDYEPSAADMVKFGDASLIFYNGMGLDSFVEKINSGKTKLLDSSIKATKAKFSENAQLQDGHSIDDGHDHSELEFDPHIWLYPINAKKQMEAIKNELCAYDPQNKDYYINNCENESKKCDELDMKMKSLSGKKIVTTHSAYTYWQKMYGIDVVSMDAGGEKEVSPAKLKEIVEYCKKNNIKVIYSEIGDSDKTAKTVANEIGGEVRKLNSYESIVENKDDYFAIMEENYLALQ